jgi:hypothetical protein
MTSYFIPSPTLSLIGPAGYLAAYAVAGDNLRLGLTVVVDVKRHKVVRKCIKVVHSSIFAAPRQRIYLKINALEKIDIKSSCLVDRWAAEFREVG